MFLKIKNTKNLFGEGGVFLFFVFSVFLKTIFFRIIKRYFSLFKNRLFFVFCFPSFCIFLDDFCVFIKVNSIQPPYPHPQTLSFSLNY